MGRFAQDAPSRLQRLRERRIQHHDHEFLASETRHHIARSHQGLHAFAQMNKHAVTHEMAMLVIDFLEMVYVDHHHTKFLLRTQAVGMLPLKGLPQGKPIECAGQRVTDRTLLYERPYVIGCHRCKTDHKHQVADGEATGIDDLNGVLGEKAAVSLRKDGSVQGPQSIDGSQKA